MDSQVATAHFTHETAHFHALYYSCSRVLSLFVPLSVFLFPPQRWSSIQSQWHQVKAQFVSALQNIVHIVFKCHDILQNKRICDKVNKAFQVEENNKREGRIWTSAWFYEAVWTKRELWLFLSKNLEIDQSKSVTEKIKSALKRVKQALTSSSKHCQTDPLVLAKCLLSAPPNSLIPQQEGKHLRQRAPAHSHPQQARRSCTSAAYKPGTDGEGIKCFDLKFKQTKNNCLKIYSVYCRLIIHPHYLILYYWKQQSILHFS